MALVEQLGNDGWQVVCAGCCRMTLVLCIMQLYKDFILFFIPVLSLTFLKKKKKSKRNLVLINLTEYSTIPVCPRLRCFYFPFVTRGLLKGLTVQKYVFNV